METEESVVLGVMELQEAKRIRSMLADRGIQVALVNNPTTCTGLKCGPAAEVHVRPEDVETVAELLQAERTRLLEGHDLDGGFHNNVFDSEKPTASCPACGTQFSTSLTECPECGLGFSTPTEG